MNREGNIIFSVMIAAGNSFDDCSGEQIYTT